uniref:Plant heme peroxidase family profile domain-containing protein n=1 Tax=Oryza barthii TaxID=65489 RepID=A0A0D3HSB5_9ORYZ
MDAMMLRMTAPTPPLLCSREMEMRRELFLHAEGTVCGDLTALSGEHTIGWAYCTTFPSQHLQQHRRERHLHLTATHPTPSSFDNAYFTDLLSHRVLLRSDLELYGSGAGNGTTDVFVRVFAANATTFEDDFAAAMERPGNLSPLNGKNGER